MSAIEHLHGNFVAGRRVQVLAAHLAPMLPEGASVLDVGAGDGRVARRLMELRPDVHCRGLDVLVRPDAAIEVLPYDGFTLPMADESHDVVLFIDVLHHCEDATRLLAEAARVTRSLVLVKDHDLRGPFAHATLRFMDRVGNRRFGVALPHHYWPMATWRDAWRSSGLEVLELRTSLGLYPWPASLIFDRRLHFVAKLGLAPEPAAR